MIAGARSLSLACVALGCALLAPGCGDGGALLVTILGPAGEVRLAVHADEARTAEERRDGLAGRSGLADDEGLLLLFPVEGEVCIQNGPVTFPIDVVYLDADAVVVAVERDVPAGETTARCHLQTLYVLEVAAGVAATVSVGDQASF